MCVLFQISLVDLAGSERANKTGATAEQLKVTSFASYPLEYLTVNEINIPPSSFLYQSYQSLRVEISFNLILMLQNAPFFPFQALFISRATTW